LKRALYGRSLEVLDPPWLADADVLVRDVDELPEDARRLCQLLGLPETSALNCVRQLHGHVDLAERSRIGAAGERELVRLLEELWPGSTVHVALSDDGMGYDVLFSRGAESWHIEVKTTTRRGRLVVFLSRHEYEVAMADRRWRMVIVGLDEDHRLSALATVPSATLSARAPHDTDQASTWESSRYQLTTHDLSPGLSFMQANTEPGESMSLVKLGVLPSGPRFAWMPDDGLERPAKDSPGFVL
jgi:hypothetical protein